MPNHAPGNPEAAPGNIPNGGGSLPAGHDQGRKKPRWTPLATFIVIMLILHLALLNFIWYRQALRQGEEAIGRIGLFLGGGQKAGPASPESRQQAHDDALRGYGLLRQNKALEALSLFNEALRLDEDSLSALCGKGEALVALQKWGEALSILNRLLKKDPANVNGLILRSVVYSRQKRQDLAMQDLRSAVKAGPALFNPNIHLARALNQAEKYDEALAVLEKTLENTNPDGEQKAILHLERIYALYARSVETKDLELEKSAGEVERLSNSPELKAQCHALMINYFVDINDHEKVLEEYEKLHRIDPTLKILINSPSGSRSAAWVCKKVALVHQVAGNFEESLKFSNRAMELTPPSWSHPMDCRLILERAEAYAHMGRLNEARIDARLWKSKNPPPPVTSNDYDDYSMMHTLLGNRKKAYQYMEKAISMAPGNYRLIGNRGVIRSILGEGEASRADFKYFMSRATPQEKRVAEKVAKNLGINISD